MKIGMLTGGGDCPGLNAVIRAVVRKGIFTYEDEFVGFMEGWRGVIEDTSMPLDLDAVGGILPRGGTILRTSRTNPSKRADGIDRCLATLDKNRQPLPRRRAATPLRSVPRPRLSFRKVQGNQFRFQSAN